MSSLHPAQVIQKKRHPALCVGGLPVTSVTEHIGPEFSVDAESPFCILGSFCSLSDLVVLYWC